MLPIMNKVIMSGWIAANLKIYTTKTGKQKADFDLIVKRNYKNSEGKYTYDYPHCTCWVPAIVQYIQKFLDVGSRIEIEGWWRTDIVQAHEKNKKTKINYVMVEGLSTISGLREDDSKGKKKTASSGSAFASMGSSVTDEGENIDVDALDW